MRNKINILKITLILNCAITATMVSCSDSDQNETKKEIIKDQPGQQKEVKKETDEEFLSSAAQINMLEIKLGDLGQDNSSMPDIKDLGLIMKSDHSKSLEELRALALRKQIVLPTSLSENNNEIYNNLKSKSGVDFDKAYSQAMVNGHLEAISKFESASVNAIDPEIKLWATSMIPLLKKHLDHALASQDKYNGIQR
jgi:putative membrane protein